MNELIVKLKKYLESKYFITKKIAPVVRCELSDGLYIYFDVTMITGDKYKYQYQKINNKEKFICVR